MFGVTLFEDFAIEIAAVAVLILVVALVRIVKGRK